MPITRSQSGKKVKTTRTDQDGSQSATAEPERTGTVQKGPHTSTEGLRTAQKGTDAATSAIERAGTAQRGSNIVAESLRTIQTGSQATIVDTEIAGTSQKGTDAAATHIEKLRMTQKGSQRAGVAQIGAHSVTTDIESAGTSQIRSVSATTDTTMGATSNTATTEKTMKATLNKTFSKKKSMSRSSMLQKKHFEEIESKRKLAELELLEIKKRREIAQLDEALKQARESIDNDYDDSTEEEEPDEDVSEKIQKWLEEQPEDILPPPRGEVKKNENILCPLITNEKKRQEPERKAEHSLPPENKEDKPVIQVTTSQAEVTSLTAAFTKALKMSAKDPGRHIQELPIFNGRSDRWLSFKAAFRDTEEYFTRTENLNRLRKCLRGSAAETVANLLIGTPEPREIIEALERRFGRPEALIRSEMEKVKNLRKITDNPLDLCIFASKVTNIVAAIEALQKIHYLYNPEMLHIIVEKLTPILKNKWYDFDAAKKADLPELKRISMFLNEEADKCGPYAPLENIRTEDIGFSAKRKPERTFTTAERRLTSSTYAKCPSCLRNNHSLAECKKFLDADINERWEIAKKTKVCFKCLRTGKHRKEECRSKSCGIENCGYPHHRLLHNKKPEEKEKVTASAQEITNTINISKERRSYLKILPVIISGPTNKTAEVYALLDEGSTVTIIDEAVTDALGIDGPSSTMWVQGIGGTELNEKSKIVDFQIQGKFSKETYTLRRARTVKKLKFTPQSVSVNEIQDCEHLQDIASDLTYVNATPKILIGQDNWELIVSRKIRAGRRDQPAASHTLLGWVLHGGRTTNTEIMKFCGLLRVIGEENSTEKSTECIMKSMSATDRRYIENNTSVNKKIKQHQKRKCKKEFFTEIKSTFATSENFVDKKNIDKRHSRKCRKPYFIKSENSTIVTGGSNVIKKRSNKKNKRQQRQRYRSQCLDLSSDGKNKVKNHRKSSVIGRNNFAENKSANRKNGQKNRRQRQLGAAIKQPRENEFQHRREYIRRSVKNRRHKKWKNQAVKEKQEYQKKNRGNLVKWKRSSKRLKDYGQQEYFTMTIQNGDRGNLTRKCRQVSERQKGGGLRGKFTATYKENRRAARKIAELRRRENVHDEPLSRYNYNILDRRQRILIEIPIGNFDRH